MSKSSKFGRAHLCALLVPVLHLTGVDARAEIVVNDTFNDAGFTNGGDAQDVAWYGMNGPAANLSVVADNGSPGIGDGNALRFTAAGALQRGVVGVLSKPITLEDGESITLTFDFRFETTTNLNYASRLRWGLYGSGGTPIDAHDKNVNWYANDEGYFAATHGTSTSSTGTSLAREKGAQDELTWGGGIHGEAYAADLGLVPGASTNLSTSPHIAVMTITRTGTTMSVTAQIDNLAPATMTDEWPTSFYFDQIAISFGTASAPGPIRIDNVVVEHGRKGVADGFTDGSITDNASDSNDTAWWGLGLDATNLTIASDSTIGSGNALQLTPNSSLTRGFVGRLPQPITLADGGSVTLNFQYRFTGTTNLNSAGRLRFGLYNAGATYTSSHNQGTVRNNDQGYYGQTNPVSASSTGTTVARESSGNELLGGSGVVTIGTAGTSVNGGTTAHTGILSIKRSGSTVIVSASIDGQTIATGTDSSPLTYTFDEVVIGVGLGTGTASPLRVDNLSVSTAPAFPVGDGTYENPVAGPAPSVSSSIVGSGFKLVKNWDFGTNGNIRSIKELSGHFRYYDANGQYNTGAGEYGAHTLAPHVLTALTNQPVEGAITNNQSARSVNADWLRGVIVPFDGVTVLNPNLHNCGAANFFAKWRLPAGGTLLGREIIWETQMRYVTPRYFWTCLWATVSDWSAGAEMDVFESFGVVSGSFDNADGKYWHSNVIGGTDDVDYTNWNEAMAEQGVTNFNAAQAHTWTWHYKADDTFAVYVDGILVQSGSVHWTSGGAAGAAAQDMTFQYDAGWGHTTVVQLRDKTLPIAELVGKYFEWNYSRVYMK
ncbi:MAG: hypothetical protein K0R17_1999 [Rariglobus sp.]|jgi:hypothetical protein|nr:hypothetical protein [Rariglobus sp.]